MKQVFDSEFYLLGNSINKAIIRRKPIVYFKSNRNHTKFLHLLTNQGYIASFQIYKGFTVIRLNPPTSSFLNVFITNSRRAGRKNFTVKLSEIKKMHYRSGGLSNTLVSTDKGVLNSLNAIEKGVGGKILFTLH